MRRTGRWEFERCWRKEQVGAFPFSNVVSTNGLSDTTISSQASSIHARVI